MSTLLCESFYLNFTIEGNLNGRLFLLGQTCSRVGEEIFWKACGSCCPGMFVSDLFWKRNMTLCKHTWLHFRKNTIKLIYFLPLPAPRAPSGVCPKITLSLFWFLTMIFFWPLPPAYLTRPRALQHTFTGDKPKLAFPPGICE